MKMKCQRFKMTNTCNKNGKCLCWSFYQNGKSRGKYSNLEHISMKPSKVKKTKEIEKEQHTGEEQDITNGVTFK